MEDHATKALKYLDDASDATDERWEAYFLRAALVHAVLSVAEQINLLPGIHLPPVSERKGAPHE